MKPEDLARLVEGDRFANHLGIELVSVEEGRAVARMRLAEFHMNFLGMPHGGAVFALADVAFSAAANSVGTKSMAFHIGIDYLAAAAGAEYLEAEVHLAGRAGRARNYEMEVRKPDGEVIAVLQGWAYQTDRPLEE